MDLYLVVRSDGMVGAGVLCVPTLGDGAFILRGTLGGTVVCTLSVDVSLEVRSRDVCSTIGGEPGFSWRD